jgi:hypothetical protein
MDMQYGYSMSIQQGHAAWQSSMERGMEMQRGQATSTFCMYMQDGHEAWKSSVDIHKGHVAFCIADLKSFCKSANLAI